MADVFEYLPQYRVLVCRVCRVAVVDCMLAGHLRSDQHKSFLHDDSKKLNRYLDYFSEFPQRISQIRELQIPQTPVPVIEQLAPPIPAYQCDFGDCRCVMKSIGRIQKHCREEHQWVNSNSRGRPKKSASKQSESPTPWKKVLSQQFVRCGIGGQRFVVVPNEAAVPTSVPSIPGDWREARQILDEMIREEEVEILGNSRIQQHDPREANPWLERMGWAHHLMGKNRTELKAMLNRADPEKEPILDEICQRFDFIVVEAQRVIMNELNVFSRFELNRKNLNLTPSRPFVPQMKLETLNRYREAWKRVIRYIFRSQQQGHTRFTVTATQEGAMDNMLLAIMDSERPSDECDGDAGRPLDAADRSILRWCIALLDHRLGGRHEQEFQSGLISGLAVLGIREDGGWEPASSFTPVLSAMIKIARMLVALQAWDDTGEDGGCLDKIREMVSRFL
ncbi:hypothetical protein VTN31DRAFT_7188 [Thermomyces dupontii]|uniref:uncharacterized protein n=1 Tax=Talaromyces thermophilus TaxID=28565 RepID=UPI003742614E